MKNHFWLIIGFFLLLGGCKEETEIAPGPADTTTGTDPQAIALAGCRNTTFKTGEIYRICVPENWNGDLILYAHGYVSEFLPLALPDEVEDYIPLFTSLGYAFATTSYSENGLAIQTGIDNIVELRKRFIQTYGEPRHIYLTGASEGGILTTLALERYPKLFSGGLSLCGPCGDFRKQINYYADFRVLFDYYFPGVLPGDAINIPDELIRNWETTYVPAIQAAISQPQNAGAVFKLLAAAGAPVVPPTVMNANTFNGQTILGVLWYDVFATRDAIRKLKGQPYDNTTTAYTIPATAYTPPGTPEEIAALNAGVDRFTADKQALKNIEKYYETSGNITRPLVKAHTTGDPIIPYWHLPLYEAKTVAQGTSDLFTGITVTRYGHCTFLPGEIAGYFSLLVQEVTGQPLAQAGAGKTMASARPAQ